MRITQESININDCLSSKNSTYCDILRKRYGEKKGNKMCGEYLELIKYERQSRNNFGWRMENRK